MESSIKVSRQEHSDEKRRIDIRIRKMIIVMSEGRVERGIAIMMMMGEN